MDWTVAKLVEATGGRLLQGNLDLPVTGISTDTRLMQPGSCFVALPGERYDGHCFIMDALARNATAFIVSSARPEGCLPAPDKASVIEVQDTLYALGKLAGYWRRQHLIPVVGITGSNGKTSTKEMVGAILSVRHRVLKNEGNFNNLIGVPLTLLSLQPHHEVAVVEMGINVPGEMARLVEMSDPTVGLITNIHPAHLEGLHSMEQILQEKSKLWMALKEDALAVVNRDDERLVRVAGTLKARTITYSLQDPSARVKLAGEVEMREGWTTFPLLLGTERISVRLPVLGLHQVQNAIAAAAVAWGMGESPETVARGLSSYQPVKQRMQMHHLRDGRVVIDDSYNANPGSTFAAVQAACTASGGKPLVVVLGEMRELGPESARLHWELGQKIAALGVARLITLGEMGKEIVRGAEEGGMLAAACHHAQDHEEILDFLKANRVANEWVLVKGSRAMAMERVVEGILAE